MRPLLIAVVLLSCAGDEVRRHELIAQRVPVPRVAASAPPAPAAPPESVPAPPPAPPPAPTKPPAKQALTTPAWPAPIAYATPSTVTPNPVPAVEVAAVDPRESTRKAAHDVLAQYCGECHEGHRSKKPEALAIYDLDLPDWPGRFNAHRFQTALGRLDKKPAPASEVFAAFRDAELAATAAH